MKIIRNKYKQAAVTAGVLFSYPITAGAAITLISGLSTGPAAGPDVNKGSITVTGPSTNGAVAQNLVDGDASATFPGAVWFNGGAAGADQTLTFDLGATVTIGSVTVDFAWADRDDMTYTFHANGSDQGSFSVANTGAGFPGEPQTTFVFDTPFTASSIDLNLTDVGAGGGGNENSPAIAEVTFHAVPEPSAAALLGLGGLALILRRRKG